MTLNFVNSISPTSVTFIGGTTSEALNQVIFVETTGNTMRRYDLTSLAQVGTNKSISSAAAGVVLVGAASAYMIRNSTSASDLVELSSEYSQTYSGLTQVSLSAANKISIGAADIGNKISLFLSGQTNYINKFDGNTFTSSSIQTKIGNQKFTCILYKSSGRFLAGTDQGQIVEMDTTGKIVERMKVFPEEASISSTSKAIRIQNLSYSYGFITAYTSTGDLIKVDWTTKRILYNHPVDSYSDGITLCGSSSGVCLVGRFFDNNTNIFQSIYELETTLNTKVNSHIFTNSIGLIQDCGINSTNAKGWAMQKTANQIHVFNVVPRTTVERVFSSPGNANFRLIVIDETAGQGHLTRVIDTYTTSPRTLLLETGKSYLELIKVGDGTDATWDVSRYSL